MITWTCNAESCEAHAEWWVGERALCGPHRALAHVQRAHAAILDMATDKRAFEFQRLHGMGGGLYERLMRDGGVAARVYAPVGGYRDLLAGFHAMDEHLRTTPLERSLPVLLGLDEGGSFASDAQREQIEGYMREVPCHACGGSGLLALPTSEHICKSCGVRTDPPRDPNVPEF